MTYPEYANNNAELLRNDAGRHRRREMIVMTDENIDLMEAPDTCEETTEYDNRIEDNELEPEEEEQLDMESNQTRGEIEQQFARYERNYRARRIRELASAPLKRKRGRPSNKVAA